MFFFVVSLFAFKSAESLCTLHSTNKAMNETVLTKIKVWAISQSVVFLYGNCNFYNVMYMCIRLYSYRQEVKVHALQSLSRSGKGNTG